MITAGLTQGITDAAGLNVNLPKEATFAQKVSQDLQQNLVRAVISTSVQSSIEGSEFGDALKNNLVSAATSVVSAALAEQIGNEYKNAFIEKGGFDIVDSIGHKAAHAVLGCAVGAVSGGGKGCGAGATGAVVAETMAEIYGHGAMQAAISEAGGVGKLSGDTLDRIANDAALVGKISSVAAAAITKQDVNIAQTAGENAVDNNFIFTTIAIIGVGLTLYDAYQNYQEGGAKQVLLGLAQDGLITVVTGGVGKLAGKVVVKVGGDKIIADTAEAAWAQLKQRKLFKNIEKACFIAGTLVLTKDGMKPIENIEVGDIVLSRDEQGLMTRYSIVEQTFQRAVPQIVNVTLQTDQGVIETLGTTDEHPFHVPGRGFVEAKDLKVGMLISTATKWKRPLLHLSSARNDDTSGFLKVKSITIDATPQKVYNFKVAGTHTYFVGETKAWVHNALCGNPITKKLTTSQSRSFRGQAQRIWEKTYGSRKGIDVHHRIPLEWSHLFPKAKPNRLSNLIGLSNAKPNGVKSYHQQINNIWSTFKKNNPKPSASDVMKQAIEIDRKFGNIYQKRR